MEGSKVFGKKVLEQVVQRGMYGLEDVVRFMVVALYTDGHILLEGNPGLGKTELVKTLSKTLLLPTNRIQFTPDLLPADVTGTRMPVFNKGAQTFEFEEGPIFTSLLLADEINRATPKTQAAMLEGMAERQVTVLGEQRRLPHPFFVLATQNPIDHEGTYALPKAQSDRFMFKIHMPELARSTLDKIIAKESSKLVQNGGGGSAAQARIESPYGAIQDPEKFYELLKAEVGHEGLWPSISDHIGNLFAASNGRFGDLVDVGGRTRSRLEKLVESSFDYGFGPRAATALALGIKGWSTLFLESEDEQISIVAKIALPVLRHRLHLRFDWEEHCEGLPDDLKTDAARRDAFLSELCVLTAPGEVRDLFQNVSGIKPWTR